MKFEEMLKEDGKYIADGFGKGVCFEVKGENIYQVFYKSKDDLMPEKYPLVMYRGLLYKDYKNIFTLKELF